MELERFYSRRAKECGLEEQLHLERDERKSWKMRA
jgi:hypothetical protein